MERKHEVALLLREHGFSYSEIIRELYPREWEEYRRSRDRRLYARLKKRVWRLLRYSSKRGPRDEEDVDPPGLWIPGLELDDGGGEREPLFYRAPERLLSRRSRKAGLKGRERQFVEYEQLLYYYKEYVRELDDWTIWGSVKAIHSMVFNEFYDRFRRNVWGVKRAGPVARAYAYAVLSAAALLHGRLDVRDRLRSAPLDDKSRQWLEKVSPIVLRVVL